MQALLEGLKRDGDYESSGSFSLDAKTSLEKLDKFQLEDPSQLVLHIVACAVFRGATRIQFEIDSDDVRVAFDGLSFSASEMESIFSSYFDSDSSPRNRSRAELAVALKCIEKLDPDICLFESWQGGNGKVMQLYEGKVWLESLENKAPTKNQVDASLQYLCYQERQNFFNYCFPSLAKANRRELTWLKERCCYGPHQLWVNGKLIRPAFWKAPIIGLRGDSAVSLPIVQADTWLDSPFSGLAVVGDYQPNQLTWVVGGTAFHESVLPLPTEKLTGLHLIVYAPELRKDLSHARLVRDEKWQSRFQEVLTVIETLSPRLTVPARWQAWVNSRKGKPQ